jgi:hypothetical protein
VQALKNFCARSSVGQSNGFLIRRSQVRILPGVFDNAFSLSPVRLSCPILSDAVLCFPVSDAKQDAKRASSVPVLIACCA